MVKQKWYINDYKLIYNVLHHTNRDNGLNGYHLQNGSTIPIMVLQNFHHMKISIEKTCISVALYLSSTIDWLI